MKKKVPLPQIVETLDRELRIGDFRDDVSHNGLQVEGAPGGVSKVCFGVDASPEFIREALRRGAQLLIVHHGISWGDSLARIAGPNYRLVAPLVKADAALYAAHLPLDAHPVLGNNAGLARAIGLTKLKPFCEYHGHSIGVQGRFPKALTWSDVQDRIRAACPDGRFVHFDGGPRTVRTVGIVSGGAAEDFVQAKAAGLDAYVTGEFGLQDYTAAQADPFNVAAAGHYATERFGVRALAGFLTERFGLDCEFIDFHLPY